MIRTLLSLSLCAATILVSGCYRQAPYPGYGNVFAVPQPVVQPVVQTVAQPVLRPVVARNHSLGAELDRASGVLYGTAQHSKSASYINHAYTGLVPSATPIVRTRYEHSYVAPSIGGLVSAKEDVFIRKGPGKSYEGCAFIPEGETATLLGCDISTTRQPVRSTIPM